MKLYIEPIGDTQVYSNIEKKLEELSFKGFFQIISKEKIKPIQIGLVKAGGIMVKEIIVNLTDNACDYFKNLISDKKAKISNEEGITINNYNFNINFNFNT